VNLGLNTILRLVLLLWVLGYLLVSCGPLFNGGLGAGLLGVLVGGVLFVPWLLGVVVLAVLVLLTNPGRPTR
jgi:hypothetical protein